MAIVNYSGSLQIAQNFTSDVERLKAIVAGRRFPSGPLPNDNGAGGLGRAAANFGTRNVIMAIRDLAKNLATIPGRKSLVLLTAGFKVSPDILSRRDGDDRCLQPVERRDLSDRCKRSGSGQRVHSAHAFRAVSFPKRRLQPMSGTGRRRLGERRRERAHRGRAPEGAAAAPQRRRQQGRPGAGTGSTPDQLEATPVERTRARRRSIRVTPTRMIVPKIPESATTNQQVMYMLADGTGGFVIVNTNDLLGGMQKIAKEMNEFYLIGYTPPNLEDGKETCHTIRVKVDKGGNTVRARTGYCNAKLKDVLAQTPTEKTLENRATAEQTGTIAASMQAPYFLHRLKRGARERRAWRFHRNR